MQNNPVPDQQFVSASSRAKYTMLFLGIGIAIDVIYILLSGLLISEESRLGDSFANNEFVRLLTSLQNADTVVQSLLTYAIGISFLVWIYRAYSNLTPLQAQHQSYTPGWAVGWWFVPIASMFVPYKIVKELWVQSDPLIYEGTEYWHRSHIPTLFICWWALYILSGIVMLTFIAFEGVINNAAFNFQTITKAVMLTKLFNIGAAFLCIKIVSGIDKRQEARNMKIQNSVNTLQPQP